MMVIVAVCFRNLHFFRFMLLLRPKTLSVACTGGIQASIVAAVFGGGKLPWWWELLSSGLSAFESTKANVQIDKRPWMHRTKTLENCSMTTSESFRKKVAEKLVARQREVFFCQAAIDVFKNGSRRLSRYFVLRVTTSWVMSKLLAVDWFMIGDNIKHQSNYFSFVPQRKGFNETKCIKSRQCYATLCSFPGNPRIWLWSRLNHGWEWGG